MTWLWISLLWIAALLVSAVAGGFIVSALLRRLSKGGQEAPTGGQLRGGTTIGVLERLATTGAIPVGQPALIAIIVAVKGFGRFDQLKGDPVASEKFTIGTLSSLLWAALWGFVALWLIDLVTTAA